MSQVQTGLFRLPDGMRRPRAQVIILTGPSGSGKTSLSSRVGLPSISLDHFYRDEDEPNMPTLTGDVIDWDDPRSWNAQEAFDALSQLCLEGRTEIPIYDIPSNRRTGTRTLELGDHELFIAEGIFASELVAPLLEEGLLADALCIDRSPVRNAWFRLLRDLAESRKSVPVLLYRGARLAREEPKKIKHWVQQGCRAVGSLSDAEASINLMLHRAQLVSGALAGTAKAEDVGEETALAEVLEGPNVPEVPEVPGVQAPPDANQTDEPSRGTA